MKPLMLGVAVVLLVGCQASSVPPRSSGSLALSHDDSTLYVADPDHHRLTVIDAQTGQVRAHVPVGQRPERVLVAPDGTVYVSNRGDRTVSRLSGGGMTVEAQGAVGAEPVGLSLDPKGERLYVANSMSGTVSVLDPSTLEPMDEIPVGGRPWAVAAHPNGKLYVTDFATGRVKVVEPESHLVVAEVELNQPTEAECEWGEVPVRTPAQPADVVFSPDGDRAYVAHVQSRTGADLGQTSLALAVAPALGTLDTLRNLVNREPRRGSPASFPAAFLATNMDASCQPAMGTNGMDAPSSLVVDGRGEWLFVADHNSNAIAVVSASRRRVAGMRDPERGIYDVVRVGARPTGIAVTGDLRTAYVHNALDYSVSVVKNEDGQLRQVDTLFFASSQLPPEVDRGRRLFFSAVDPRVTRPEMGGVSCSSCHPDGLSDGLNWVLPEDGRATFSTAVPRPRNTPSLFGVTETSPYHWGGHVANMPDFSAKMVSQMGGGGLRATEIADLTSFIATLEAPDNPNTQAVLAGVEQFAARCEGCHLGPALTDRLRHKRWQYGDLPELDTPSLRGVFATGPYLHDGSARTLEEVLTRGPFSIREHDHRGTPPEELEALVRHLRSL